MVGHDQRHAFAQPFGAGVLEHVMAFGGKTHAEGRVGQPSHGGEDVWVFSQFDNGRRAAAVFFQLFGAAVGHVVVSHGGHADEYVAAAYFPHYSVVHFTCAVGMVHGHPGGQVYLKLPGHQHHFRPGGTAGLRQRHTHAAAGQIGDAAHGVDGLKGGAGREQHAFAHQQFGCPQIGQQFGQFGGFEHAAFAGFATGLAAAGGAEHGNAIGL